MHVSRYREISETAGYRGCRDEAEIELTRDGLHPCRRLLRRQHDRLQLLWRQHARRDEDMLLRHPGHAQLLSDQELHRQHACVEG